MLTYSRWKTTAILGVTVLVCLAAVPSALPKDTFAQLPRWAQWKFQFGYDLTGGERIQLIVDRADARQYLLDRLKEDMRGILRQQRIGHAGMQVRENAVEVVIRNASDMPRAVDLFRHYSRPLEHGSVKPAPRIPADGRASVIADRSAPVPAPDLVMTASDRVIRLAYTDAAEVEHRRVAVHWSFEIMKRRIRDLGMPHQVHRIGDRIVVETAALGWRNIMY